MPARKVKTLIKLNIPAGGATAAPPVGPALGQHGLPIMDFVKQFNDATADKRGNILPVVITAYDYRTFTFITKEPPVAEMIKKALNIQKGSGKAGKESAGILTQAQVRSIAEAKLPDMNTKNVEAAMKVVAGTARSMGIKVQ